MHGMVRALAVLLENLQLAVQVARAGTQDVGQRFARQMQRTRCRYQEAIAALPSVAVSTSYSTGLTPTAWPFTRLTKLFAT